MTVKLEKSKHTVTLLDEVTGEIAIEMEKAYKSSVNIDQEIEQARKGFRPKPNAEKKTSLKFAKDKKVLMEFAHLMITEIKDEKNNDVAVSENYVKQLGLTDYKTLRTEIEKLTADVDFF